MADEHGRQQAQPAEKKGPSKFEVIVNEYVKQIAIPVAIGGVVAAAHKVATLFGSIPAAASAIGATLEQIVSKGNIDISTGRLLSETATGAAVGSAAYAGLQAVNGIPKVFGLEHAVANVLGYVIPVSTFAVGTATLGILAPAAVALYYSVSHLFNNNFKFEGMGKDFKEHYLKGLARTMPLNILSSLGVAALYAGYTLTPYIAIPAALGLGALYRLALSREKINYFYLKLATLPVWGPIVGASHLIAGAVTTAYEAVKGAIYQGLSILNHARVGIHDLGFATHMAMMGAVPAPAAKKGH
ncbi:hypothetical protein HYV80_06295 [Candidatus Woesearchaeota archaeon]|nr:hypothetical protein [Candidatus Woesearchaeota archaeon]